MSMPPKQPGPPQTPGHGPGPGYTPGYRPAPVRRPNRNNSTLKILLIIFGSIIAIGLLGICVVVGGLYFVTKDAIERVSEVTAASDAEAKARKITIALLNYHDEHREFPPAVTKDANGKPLHSWRTLLLKHMDCADYRKIDFDKPWNDPANLAVLKSIDARNYFGASRGDRERVNTGFVAVVADDTVLREGKSIRIRDVRAGTSNTAVVIELESSDIPWYEPRDVSPEKARDMIRNSSYEGGIAVGYVDGTARMIRQELSDEVAKELFKPER